MKIGILTVHRLPNWGSAMQGYALQKIIESLGHECECINYTYPNPWHIKRGSWKRPSTKLKTKIAILLGIRAHSKFSLIEKFVKKEIKESRQYSTFEDIHSNPPQYDIYVSGSDQIWNWKTVRGDSTFMLDFVPDGKKKIAYSSSFSVNYIPENLQGMYKDLLSKFSAISVRENNGSRLVKELIGKEAPVVLDPSLLLDKKHWGKLATKAKWKQKMPDKFILSYMLGYTYNPKPAMAKLLEKLQSIYQCPVIPLGNNNELFNGEVFSMLKSQEIGVYEFLWLISHATVVATSSFHGTAFAVNMGTPLISLVEKENQEDDRIPSFLKSVGLEKNLVTVSTNFNNLILNGKYQADEIQNNLMRMREESKFFLRKNLCE